MNREGYASYTEGAMGPGETGAAGVSGIAAYRQLLEEKSSRRASLSPFMPPIKAFSLMRF